MIVATVMLATASEASACACCDGGARREVVGWSTSGNSALVRMQGVGCEDVLALEVLRRGDDEPVGCFDLYSETPAQRVACNDLAYGFDRWDPRDRPQWRDRPLPRQRSYPGAPTQIAASHLRATLTHVTPQDDLEPPLRLEVFALGARGWVPLFERPITRGRPEDGRDIEDMSLAEQITARSPLPIEVRVWPSPNGRHALVEVSGQNEAPGIGHYPDAMSWIRLPPGLNLPTIAPAEADGRALALQPIDPDFTHGDRERDRIATASARRVNAAALRAHRAGDFGNAAALFATAAMTDARDPMSRYNLACALAQLGQEAPALAVLEDLKRSGCPRCAERLERARHDPDLAPLRDRLP